METLELLQQQRDMFQQIVQFQCLFSKIWQSETSELYRKKDVTVLISQSTV